MRKVMIDSRFRKSGTPGDFTYELGRAITLPTNCAGMVLDVEMIHSWYNIDDHNNNFYFMSASGGIPALLIIIRTVITGSL